jgi:hypothetical protein
MVPGMPLPNATQDALLSLYRGEAAAVDAYDRALNKFEDQPEEPILGEIRGEHAKALRRLDAALEQHGLKTPESSGAWGAVANAVHSLTALVNDELPLQVLQRGEDVGLTAYERAIAAEGFEPAFVQQLREGHALCQRHRERLQLLRDAITTQPNRPMI